MQSCEKVTRPKGGPDPSPEGDLRTFWPPRRRLQARASKLNKSEMSTFLQHFFRVFLFLLLFIAIFLFFFKVAQDNFSQQKHVFSRLEGVRACAPLTREAPGVRQNQRCPEGFLFFKTRFWRRGPRLPARRAAGLATGVQPHVAGWIIRG